MAHFAKVLNGIVQQVIVAEPEFFETFVDDSPGEWIQTSYNTRGGIYYDPETGSVAQQKKALRYNFAGVGYHYDPQYDAFYPSQPFPSWELNKQTFLWDPPVPLPLDGKDYDWNEETQQWDEVTYDISN